MQKFCHFASKNIYKWPKGIYVQIELSEQGKAESPMDNPAKNNKRMNLC